MKYFLSKLFIILFCSIFIAIGAGFTLSSLASRHHDGLFGIPFGLFFIGIGSVIMVTRLRQISKFEKMTYQWYKSTYPGNVQGNRVTCYECGNNRINVRALLNRTFHREHVCTQCGKALYYSPE